MSGTESKLKQALQVLGGSVKFVRLVLYLKLKKAQAADVQDELQELRWDEGAGWL
jgi:hypothetical protein